MSPAGMNQSRITRVWSMNHVSSVSHNGVNNSYMIRPVINLRSNIIATGTGTSTDP